MTALQQKMIEDMQLRGLAERTQQSYVAAVKGVAGYYDKGPDKVSEAELRGYFLYLKNEKKVSANTQNQILSDRNTLGRAVPELEFVKPERGRKLPVVMSRAEEFIRRFLHHVLPKGFVKVRYYGLFAPGQHQRLKQARELLEADRPLSQ